MPCYSLFNLFKIFTQHLAYRIKINISGEKPYSHFCLDLNIL